MDPSLNPSDALTAIRALQFQTTAPRNVEARWESAAWMLDITIQVAARTWDIDLDEPSQEEKQLKKEITTLKQQLNQQEEEASTSETTKELTNQLEYIAQKLSALQSLLHALTWLSSPKRTVYQRPTSANVPGTTAWEVRVKASGTPEGELWRIGAKASEVAEKVRDKVEWLNGEVGRVEEVIGVVEKRGWDPRRGEVVRVLG